MSRLRRWARSSWRWLYKHRLTVWIWLFTFAVTWALWTSYENDQQLRAANDRDDQAAELDDARSCVIAWDVRESLRDSVERAGRAGARASAEALIAVVGDEVEPATVELFRSQIEQQTQTEVDAARAEIPDPDCDRAAALEALEHR